MHACVDGAAVPVVLLYVCYIIYWTLIIPHVESAAAEIKWLQTTINAG